MKKIRKTALILCLCLLAGAVHWGGCAAPAGGAGEESSEELILESSLSLRYAKNFSVDHYRGGYTMLTLMDGSRFLLVDEDSGLPEGLDEDVVILRRPLERLYLVASAAMDMICALDALDAVSLSGQKAEGWYIQEARAAMENGSLVYAGKYNQPDYELILSSGCRLAIENRMITHSPEVAEKLEEFGIPVLIDYSSSESHPLGRVEWIKFYGALLGKEELAGQLFDEQEEILERVTGEPGPGGTEAFFYIGANGQVQVRASGDYVPAMIELAGGKYIFGELLGEGGGRSTVNIQMEEFYRTARDADYLIYNSAIDGGVATLEDLLDKDELLKDFKAVKEGHVWCTSNDMYQQSMAAGYLTEDIHRMLSEEDPEDLRYLFRLE